MTLHGGSAAAEANAIVGQLWLTVGRLQMSLRMGRVESASNAADDPSRGKFEWLRSRHAQFHDPILPPWVLNPWLDPLSQP